MEAIVPTILVGSISGTVVGIFALIVNKNTSMRTALPFGPFLAFGAMVHMFLDLSFFY
jgi:prepilin signal peptidase PulO-like enzyme (type II secretory pathway)